jgi:hypothetical protein
MSVPQLLREHVFRCENLSPRADQSALVQTPNRQAGAAGLQCSRYPSGGRRAARSMRSKTANAAFMARHEKFAEGFPGVGGMMNVVEVTLRAAHEDLSFRNGRHAHRHSVRDVLVVRYECAPGSLADQPRPD